MPNVVTDDLMPYALNIRIPSTVSNHNSKAGSLDGFSVKPLFVYLCFALGGCVSSNKEEPAPRAQLIGNGSYGTPARYGIYYTKPGDYAVKIASEHNLTLAELTKLNPGVDWTKVRVGQPIRVPRS
jgi:hypothetical protein